MTERRVRIAVPGPFSEGLDYLATEGAAGPGARVRVPLGRRTVVGLVLDRARNAEPDGLACRPVTAILDPEPLLSPDILALIRWVADYYHHPIGEVVAAALPAVLRRGEALRPADPVFLHLTPAGRAQLASVGGRAPARRRLLEMLAAGPQRRADLAQAWPRAAPAIRQARDQGWVEEQAHVAAPGAVALEEGPAPGPAQAAALEALDAAPAGFSVTLLEGVTGSGKTEVYLRRVEKVLAAGGQALVLTPEIGLTPQLVERFTRRFGAGVAAFHSGLAERARAQVWARAREGRIGVLVGTRSAVFVPMPKLALVVIDEEHDASLKQQEGLRYHARDVAIVRARAAGVPVILGSATPSLETLHNAQRGRYRHLRLQARAQDRPMPAMRVLDVRRMILEQGLSAPMLDAVGRHLDAGGQALLFINRRGYAPVLLCHDCGWTAPCPHCDARMTLHRARGRLVCHHCGTQAPMPARCEQCGSTPLVPVGQGTERVEDALRMRFPAARIERLDSDRASHAGELERLLADARAGKIDILVGTQLLAKGHDFGGLTLVGVIDADQALFSADFRAMERLGQLLTQVAGRAGRGAQPGEVMLQTHQPDHPLLQLLLREGYPALAAALLDERRAHGLPPFAHLALLRADALEAERPMAYLRRVAQGIGTEGVDVLGPVPAPMERRAGRIRAQLLLRASSRTRMQALLASLAPEMSRVTGARQVRWSIDVDPVDLF